MVLSLMGFIAVGGGPLFLCDNIEVFVKIQAGKYVCCKISHTDHIIITKRCMECKYYLYAMHLFQLEIPHENGRRVSPSAFCPLDGKQQRRFIPV